MNGSSEMLCIMSLWARWFFLLYANHFFTFCVDTFRESLWLYSRS